MLRALLPSEQEILDIIEGTIGSLGYDIVRVKLKGDDDNQTLQIMIDRKDDKVITVDDCSKASVQVSAMLDVHDPIPSAYNLEVSSPGMDRPLTRVKDFQRYVGFDVRAESRISKEGERRFKGVLIAADEESCVISAEPSRLREASADIRFAYTEFAAVKLVYTDKLVAFVTGVEDAAGRDNDRQDHNAS